MTPRSLGAAGALALALLAACSGPAPVTSPPAGPSATALPAGPVPASPVPAGPSATPEPGAGPAAPVTSWDGEGTELVNLGDFEGVLVWAAGVRGRAGFTVTVLDGPPRLVIDVAHAP